MRRMITTLFGATVLVGAGLSGVRAADLPTKAPAYAPSYIWTGFYAGGNVGYGFGQAPTGVGFSAAEANVVTDPLLCPSSICAPIPASSRLNGFIGGGQAGYNLQLGSIVAGLETDLSYARMRKSDTATGVFYIGGILSTTIETKLDWFGTVRGRIGFLPTSNLLLYGTGGLAYGAINTTVTTRNLNAPCGLAFIYCTTGSTGGTSVGWAAGAGAEYALTPAWTVKAEYLHIDLGSRAVTAIDPAIVGGTVTSTTAFKMDTVKAGFNYKFGAP